MIRALLVATLCIAAPAAWAGVGGQPSNPGNEAVVSAFVAAWQGHDVDRVLSYVTDDCYYLNVPLQPIQGKATMRTFLEPFFRKDGFVVPFELRPETLHLVSGGNVVMQERVDHYVVGSAHYDIPVVGYFELRDGHIAVWKDYFDMAQFQPVVSLMQALQRR